MLTLELLLFVVMGFFLFYQTYKINNLLRDTKNLDIRIDVVREQKDVLFFTATKLMKINTLKDIGKYCCWVHEYGGYWAYCHKDGRLIIRTGHGKDVGRTWSSVGNTVLKRNGVI